jgi:hypothetical protein
MIQRLQMKGEGGGVLQGYEMNVLVGQRTLGTRHK